MTDGSNKVGDQCLQTDKEPMKSVKVTANDLINVPDSATIVICKVKSLSFIENIHGVLAKEGFRNVDVNYIGGSWVWIEFDNRKACTRFKQRAELLQYFLEVQTMSRQFVVDDKIVWIEISGMPLGAWSAAAFKKVAAVWGEVVFLDSTQ